MAVEFGRRFHTVIRFHWMFGVVGFVLPFSILTWPGSLPGQQEGDPELVQFVIQLLGESDQDMRALGLEQIRTQAGGEGLTKQFAAHLPNVRPAVQVELIRALTDRGDPAARAPIIVLLMSSEQQPVRAEAIRALGFLGEPEDAPLLLQSLKRGTEAEKSQARESLIRLPGEAISRATVGAMRQADPSFRVALMEILVARRAADHAADLVPRAVDENPQVRAAAMKGLSELAGAEQIPGMARGVLAAEKGRERDAAEKALMRACHRIGEDDEPAKPLLAAMDDLSEPDRIVLLSALGRVGGTAALKVLKVALAAPSESRHQAALRALCNWPDASVAPQLIELARSEPRRGNRIAALRALIRVAPVPDGRSHMEKLELLRRAMTMCVRDEERKLVLRRAGAVRLPETLQFLVPYLDQPTFTQHACQSIVELAHHRSLREPNEAAFHEALEKVKQVSTDPVVVERADRYQKDQTWTGDN
ncbi:MAG: HEAT repeat domain-containing protein [Planctomycetota bacterium]